VTAYLIDVFNPTGTRLRTIMAKRGRKRHNVEREPNGRALRTIPEPADSVAIEARAKVLTAHWGISAKDAKEAAKQPLTSTFIGLLYYTKQISKVQYEASQSFLALLNKERKRTSSALAHYEAAEGSGPMLSQDDIDTRNRATAAKYQALQKAIQDAQNYQRGNLWAAIQYCVVDNNGFEHMIGDLRLALNAVDQFFNGVRARRAA